MRSVKRSLIKTEESTSPLTADVYIDEKDAGLHHELEWAYERSYGYISCTYPRLLDFTGAPQVFVPSELAETLSTFEEDCV